MEKQISTTDELKKEIVPVIHKANSLVVTNPQEYNFAAGFRKDIKSAQKRVSEFFAPMKKKAYDAWKSITSTESDVLEPLGKALSTVDFKLINYQKQKEKKRLEEQRRLQAKADAKAEREKNRLIKQANNLKTPELKEERLAEVEEIETPVVTVQSEVEKVNGMHTRKYWKGKILDEEKFIKWCVENNRFEFIDINQKEVNAFATRTKGKIEIPNVKFYIDEKIAQKVN